MTYDAHQAVKQDTHNSLVLAKRLNEKIEEYRSVNMKHFNAPEMNDMRRHYSALGEVPTLIRMLDEEILLIRRHGPRPAPWWDLIN